MAKRRKEVAEPMYITTSEIASELDVAPSTVTRWLTSGMLPGQKFGRAWRVKREDYEKFKEAPPALPPKKTD